MPTGHPRRTRQRRRRVQGQSTSSHGLADSDVAERLARNEILAKAKAGDAEAIRMLLTQYHLRSWYADGERYVLLNGVGVPC